MIISESFEHEEVVGFKFGYQPIGKPRLFSHIYFVDGLLIDTGQSNVRSTITSKVKELSVEQIFITHHHEDHTGNIAEIKELHGCNAYASERCCQMMKDPPKLSFAQKIAWGDRASQSDLIPKYDTVETNNFSFNIIPIPGHAPDMVALYEPNRQWLFSADLYINSYIDYFLADESIADQI
ncbi:MAG: MBL fold metallo-hydrolase [Cyclobacteriaceae bacterium]